MNEAHLAWFRNTCNTQKHLWSWQLDVPITNLLLFSSVLYVSQSSQRQSHPYLAPTLPCEFHLQPSKMSPKKKAESSTDRPAIKERKVNDLEEESFS